MKCVLALLLASIIPFSCAARTMMPARRPNIIMILSDDLGWSDVSFNGRKEWRTPQLDRLAKQGTTFRRFYTGAVTCAPSRAVLMTGRYSIHNGVTANFDDLPAGETTIPEALKPLGYTSALFGKWHHGRPRPGSTNYVHPLDHGFDEFAGFTDARHAWEHFPTNLWVGRALQSCTGYSATIFADRSIDFIQRHRAAPFFLYLAFTEPHLWIEAPARDVARFKGRFAEKDASRPVNAAYAAMITRMDAEIGRVLRALDDAGLAQDTLVVFSSDHGATFEQRNEGAANYHDSNHPFRGQKRWLWEGGIRVPGCARWPGKIPAGKISEDVTHMMDLLPTFLAAAGSEPKSEWKVDGANLLPVWLGKEPSPARTLFWEWRAEGYHQLAALRGDFKLVVTGNTTPELFHVIADPAERRSLAHERTGLARELRQGMIDWLATESAAARWGKTNRVFTPAGVPNN